MDFKIVSEIDKPLLSRKEVKVELAFFGKATPSKSELAKLVSEKLGVSEDLVVVKTVFTDFGQSRADCLVFVYSDKDSMLKIDRDAQRFAKKASEASKKEAEAKPKEAPKEEAPKEESKEAPVEEKKEDAPKEEAKEG